MAKGPGKHYREGVTMMAIADMFSTDDKATQWFESWMWPGGEIVCMKCGSLDAYRVKSRKPMPYRCRDCRQYFSLKTCTAMEDSKLPLRLWGWAIYLEMTNLKGVSSMKLSRDLGIRQATAWHMLHRIREAFSDIASHFEGPVEVDETYVGGQRKNMSNAKRRELAGTGRGTVGKTAVVGAKDRATNMVTAHVVQRTDRDTLQGFVKSHTRSGAKIYTDEASAYDGLPNRETVKHSVGEYVRGLAHTNGVESFWAMLKRGYHGVYHQMSEKHLQRYVNEFAGRHNIREMDTLAQIQHVVAGMVGRRLMYRDLVAD